MQVQVCTGKACSQKYSKYILARLENDIDFYNTKKLEVIEASCMGNCKKAPNIKLKNTIHNYMNPAKASELIQKNIK